MGLNFLTQRTRWVRGQCLLNQEPREGWKLSQAGVGGVHRDTQTQKASPPKGDGRMSGAQLPLPGVPSP